MAVPRRVRQHREFETDFVSQLGWLVEHGERSWVTNLLAGTVELVEMVREFPAAGAIVDRRGSITLRQLRHPRGPYLVWYLMDESKPNSAIWMARLFHIRQMRPPPAIGRWTDGRE